MPRLYCPPPLPSDGPFDLPGDAAHHAARVLRLRKGDRVQLFDGLGHECDGVIAESSGKHVFVDDIVAVDGNRESSLAVLLAQSMPSGEKMDWVIQKATELGVSEIQAIDTERSVAKLPAARMARRLEHWQHVAIAACEQCGRNVLPQIHPPVDVRLWLEKMQQTSGLKLMLTPHGTATFAALKRPVERVTLLIGAEGGLTQAESDAAIHAGFTPVRMGGRVLRTETAAIAGLAALQTLWGDFQQ